MDAWETLRNVAVPHPSRFILASVDYLEYIEQSFRDLQVRDYTCALERCENLTFQSVTGSHNGPSKILALVSIERVGATQPQIWSPLYQAQQPKTLALARPAILKNDAPFSRGKVKPHFQASKRTNARSRHWSRVIAIGDRS